MPVSRGVAATFTYTAWDFTNNVGKSGDAANHTLKLIRDGVESAPTASPSELDGTNLPGLYSIQLSGAEMTASLIVVGGKSATAGVAIVPTEIATE